MPFLVTDSAVSLPAETLPALKLTHYYDAPARGDVYAYLRCYIYKGALCYNLLVFDGAPPPTERIGFALCPAESEGEFLFASFGKAPGSDTLALCRAQPGGGYAAVRAFSAPAARRGAGEDEQGPYWCAEGTVPADVLRSAFGCVPQAGGFWPGNVFLYDTAAPGFGAAFPCPGGPGGWQPGFEPFVIVPY